MILGVALLATAGCGATQPPTGWQTGGTELYVPRARWIVGDVIVDVDQEGRVLLGGKHALTIDRVGRVYDAYNQPVALLGRDGMLHGEDDEPLGWVGAGEAMLPARITPGCSSTTRACCCGPTTMETRDPSVNGWAATTPASCRPAPW